MYALAVLELLFAPIPGEVVMALAGFLASRGSMGFWHAVIAGTSGNLTGALVQYWLGLKVARPVLLRLGRYLLFSERDLEAAERFFLRRGFTAVLVGRIVPGVRSVVSIPAGAARMKVPAFAAATLAGSLPWNLIFVYAGFMLGENWPRLLEYSRYLDTVGALALLSASAYVAVKLVQRNRRACASHTSSTPRAPSGTRRGGT